MRNIKRKICLIAIIFIFVNISAIVLAESSVEDVRIEDTNNYFTQEELTLIEDEILYLPEVYKFIILPSIDMDIKDMANLLFERRGFSQDTILILILTNDKRIYITTGEALQKKELNEDFFNIEIDKYFFPAVKEQSICQALLDLTIGISCDIPEHLAKEKSSIKIPNPVEEHQGLDSEGSSMHTSIVTWLVVILLLVVCLVMFFLLISKKGN